jgi:glucosylceramidase
MGHERLVLGKAAVVAIGLLCLLTAATFYAPRLRTVTASVETVPAASPLRPVVETWLSTANRRLKMAPQDDLAITRGGHAPADITIDVTERYQSMVGFGAAMTDSSAWLVHNRMDAAQRRALMQELYGPPPNLNLNMMRVTIGSSDFSLNVYTLDDIPFGQTDPQLKYFNIAPVMADVVPSIQQALSINPGLLIIASPWTAPAWMKTTGNLYGGELLQEFESAYADYLIRFVTAYRALGIPIFALTLQNEPRFQPISYPGMGMPADTRARIIGDYLGPRLAKRAPGTRILDWDHNWSHPDEPLTVFGDAKASPYVDGVAWHCYEGSQHEQGRVHRAFPDKNTYITECSGGDWSLNMNGELLWSARNLLVTGIRQWARGVVYWNLALDENHGPHFGGCALCKGLVTIDSSSGDVTRNDEYYAIEHFSRFVLPGAYRVKSNDTDAEKGLANVAFQNPDGSVALVVVNIRKESQRVAVAEGERRFEYLMPPESVATFAWSQAPAGVWMRRALQWLNRGGPAAPEPIEVPRSP